MPPTVVTLRTPLEDHHERSAAPRTTSSPWHWWAWSQGTTPLPTSGPGYFKKSGISAGTLFYQKAGNYGQSRVHGYTNKKPASSQGDEDASNSPLFIVDMTKLIMFTSEMGEPITKMD